MEMRLILRATDGPTEALKAIALAADIGTLNKVRTMCVQRQASHACLKIPPSLDDYKNVERVHVAEADMLRSAGEGIANDGARRIRERRADDMGSLVLEGGLAGNTVDTNYLSEVDFVVMGAAVGAIPRACCWAA